MQLCYRSRPIVGTAEIQGIAVPWESMTLHQFASWFRLLPKAKQGAVVLQNDAGYAEQRRKMAVVTFPYMSSEKQPEDYFLALLMLYVP